MAEHCNAIIIDNGSPWRPSFFALLRVFFGAAQGCGLPVAAPGVRDLTEDRIRQRQSFLVHLLIVCSAKKNIGKIWRFGSMGIRARVNPTNQLKIPFASRRARSPETPTHTVAQTMRALLRMSMRM